MGLVLLDQQMSGAYYYRRRAVAPRNPQALDADLARALWRRSEELLGGRLSDPV
ncbi:hypothetical protein ACFXKG_36180 [Streptomyces sp. NPDC059255]|uniref:hypothetical protein n=1 Tax=Streptomyces sp. NPDC059255 TaxID=3346793 RepID=UPI0036A7F8FE